MTKERKPRNDLGKKRAARVGSLSWKLGQLEVGEHVWLDPVAGDWKACMRSVFKPVSRQPLDTIGKKFVVKAYRAIPAEIDGDVEILIKATRTE